MGERLIQPITITPTITPMIAAVFFTLGAKYPNKNNPNIPPLNMEASFHHASNALFTLIIAMAIKILNILKIKEETYNIFIDLRHALELLESNLKKLVSITVAELLILVETVLIPAAKIDAINNPVRPTGN